jgi:hypothetical protein
MVHLPTWILPPRGTESRFRTHLTRRQTECAVTLDR